MNEPDILKPQSKYLEVNRLRLHYLEWDGPTDQTLLLLHGFLGHAHVWDALAARFSSEYRVIALDQRGHGESQWSAEGAYSLEDHFADIAQIVERLDLEKLVLTGHSMGGRNALFFAACLPEKVQGLVLVDSRPASTLHSAAALRQLLTVLPLQAGSLGEIVLSIRKHYPHITPEICYHLAMHGYRKTRRDRYESKCDPQMSLNCEKQGCCVEEIWLFLKNVACPTLVVRGENSPFLSRDDARMMCKLMPAAMWTEIPGTTHLPEQENPQDCNRVLTAFLNGLHKGLSKNRTDLPKRF
jgi:esterase